MKSRVNEILQRFREFVSEDGFEEHPVLTAYVNIDPTDADNRKERPGWLVELKNEAKDLEASLDQEKLKHRATHRKWAGTEDWVMDQLNNRQSTGRSVVLFTDHNEFFSVDLPLPSPTKLYYGLPQVKHMLFNLDQCKKYLVVLLSGGEVRALEIFLARTTDELRVDTRLNEKGRFGRSGHSHKQDSRSEEHERRFSKEVATELNQYFLGDPDFERLVLGGNLKQAHAVKNGLHPSVRDKLVAVEAIEFNANEEDIARHTKEIADRFELEHDLTVVDDLLARSNSNGTGVVERQAVDTALSRGLVKTLIIPYPITQEDFDSLIVNATLSGAEVEFVYGEAADKLGQYGGIGAKLYYSHRA